LAREDAELPFYNPPGFTNFLLATRLRSFGIKKQTGCGQATLSAQVDAIAFFSVDLAIEAGLRAKAMMFASHVTLWRLKSDDTYNVGSENVGEDSVPA